METRLQSRGSVKGCCLFVAGLLLLSLSRIACCQCAASEANSGGPESAPIRASFEEKNWLEVVRLAASVTKRTADENYKDGMALAHLQRWVEARAALLEGERACPGQERFAVELAGVAFQLERYPEAAAWLRKVLRADPRDEYANDFAGTVYLLMGNTSAALKYWNRVQKPCIAAVNFDPQIRLQRLVLDRAFAFSPAAALREADFETTRARLDALGVFPKYNIVLSARADGNFDAGLHATERNGFGSGWAQGLISTLSGVPYETVYPGYFNAGKSATNVESLLRWDSQKLRVWMNVSAPLYNRPEWQWALTADARDENWAVRRSFSGTAPVLGSLDLERQSISGVVTAIHSGRVQWSTGAEVSHRTYHDVVEGTALTPALVVPGYVLKARAGIDGKAIEIPERRFVLSTLGGAEIGRMWPAQSQVPGSPHVFGKLEGSALAHWFPKPDADTYEIRQHVRAAKTFTGAADSIPFDELYMLGMERDTDLWLRGQIGTRDRKKGSSPLASSYFLANTDAYRRIYSNGLISFKSGPLLDIARAAAPTSGLATSQWLFDVGVDAKITVMGTSVVLTYGYDLRSGSNAFYATTAHE